MGPGENVELREVRRKIVERSEAKQKINQMKPLNRENKGDISATKYNSKLALDIMLAASSSSKCKLAVKLGVGHPSQTYSDSSLAL